jgi:hypothetical protein
MANSKKRCKHCKEYIAADSGVKRPIGFFCDDEHVMSFIHDKQAKQRKKAAKSKVKADKKDLRERKLAIKPKSKWLSEAQANFNKYIRIRDLSDDCISCGLTNEFIENRDRWMSRGIWDAGHWKSRGAKGQLRFILFNVNKQCKKCNASSNDFSHKEATTSAGYKVNLIKKIGLKKVEWLECNNELDTNKNDIEYLKRIKSIFGRKHRLYLKLFR